MYITITPQKLGGNYSKSSAGFVDYLEKENQGMEVEEMEHFFNQNGDEISAEEVIREIDGNTAKLEKTEPRFYSITVSPSKYELNRLQDKSQDLKSYTRELMKEYVSSFNREINGRPVELGDIKYYAKIEHQRTFCFSSSTLFSRMSGFFLGSASSKRDCIMATVGLVWLFSISFRIAITPLILFLIRLSNVFIFGPITSSGEIPFISKNSIIDNNAIDWDLEIDRLNRLNFLAMEDLIFKVSNFSFLYSSSIF